MKGPQLHDRITAHIRKSTELRKLETYEKGNNTKQEFIY